VSLVEKALGSREFSADSTDPADRVVVRIRHDLPGFAVTVMVC
jgi:hypothetical protein